MATADVPIGPSMAVIATCTYDGSSASPATSSHADRWSIRRSIVVTTGGSVSTVSLVADASSTISATVSGVSTTTYPTTMATGANAPAVGTPAARRGFSRTATAGGCAPTCP